MRSLQREKKENFSRETDLKRYAWPISCEDSVNGG